MPFEIKPASEFNPEAPEIGFYDLSEEVYRPAPGENWSTMKNIGRTPKKYKYRKDNPSKRTPAMAFGNLFHTVVLEPHLLDKRYTPFPETYPAKGKKVADPDIDKKWTMNAKFCKEWVEDIQEKGLEPFKQSDINYAKAMARELLDLEDAQEILEGADGYEVSCFWTNEKYQIPCKCKLDILKNGQIGDLKKITSSGGGAEWESFSRAVRSYGYHGQAAFYRDGVNAVYEHFKWPLPEIPMWRWLVVEDEAPYDTAIYSIFDHTQAESYQWFEAGRELYLFYLGQIHLYRDKNVWPSYNVGPGQTTEDFELTIPDWLKLGIVR
jgi:hypothetical protein